MRTLIFMLFSIVFTGCGNNPYTKLDQDEVFANQIMSKVARQLKKDKDLYPCGSGGQMMSGVKMLALSFNYYKEIGIEEGRELLVDAVNCFVTAVNADDRIRPYLVDYPFQPKNIEITIFLFHRDGSSFEPGKVCGFIAREGVMKYEIHTEDMRLKTILRETYDEAVKKVAEKTSDQNVVEKMAS